MLAVAFNLLPSIVQACAVCWGADDALAHGLNVSILFLMAMPFMIGGCIIGVLFIAQKHAQGQQTSTVKPFVRTIKEGSK
jgi:hypothetical protein